MEVLQDLNNNGYSSEIDLNLWDQDKQYRYEKITDTYLSLNTRNGLFVHVFRIIQTISIFSVNFGKYS